MISCPRPQIDEADRLQPVGDDMVARPHAVRLGGNFGVEGAQAGVPVAAVGAKLRQFLVDDSGQ